MARTQRGAKLDTRSARLKLPALSDPHWLSLGPHQALGYFKPAGGGAGTWRARLYLSESRTFRKMALGTTDDYADADGKTVFSFAQAQARARNWFLEAQAEAFGERLHTGPFTVADAAILYLEHHEQAGQASLRDSGNRIRLHILPDLGNAEVAKLTRSRLETWRDKLAAHPGKVKGRKGEAPKDRSGFGEDATDRKRARKATVNRTLAILKAMLTLAKAKGMVSCPDEAWRYLKPFRAVEEARQSYLSPEEQVRLLNAIQEPDFKRLVSGALLTGARYGELIRMQVRDFDAAGTGSVLVAKGKDGKPRRAMLTAEGKSFFEGITAGCPPQDLIFQKDPDPRLLAVKRGEVITLPWCQADQLRRMAAACALAGLPRIGFHQLRHSYASALVAAGMPLALVAKLTGHADTRMLEKHYAHLAPSELSRALEALAPKLAGGLGIRNVAALRLKNKA